MILLIVKEVKQHSRNSGYSSKMFHSYQVLNKCHSHLINLTPPAASVDSKVCAVINVNKSECDNILIIYSIENCTRQKYLMFKIISIDLYLSILFIYLCIYLLI